jgi:hypothetical protein
MRMAKSLVFVASAALLLGTRTAWAQARFRQADLDSTGQLRIVLSTNKILRPPRDSNQVAFGQVALSGDRRTVGWVALYANCCTSYPIPLELVLLGPDGHRTVFSNGSPIWQWSFSANGRNVVIRQAPVHGDAPEHYELHEIATGRLIATAERDRSRPGALPEWARAAAPRQAPRE